MSNNTVPIKKPELIPIDTLKPFTRFCCSIGMIPSSYKASMTYEEQIMWLCHFLEDTLLPTVNTNTESFLQIEALFEELHDYVEHYFDNLDVQQEINNKLDEMAEDGYFKQILRAYIDNSFIQYFDTVADLKNANLSVGQIAGTNGYYSKNDGGNGLYNITTNVSSIANNGNIIELNNGLKAILISIDNVNPNQFGAYGDGVHDDTSAVQNAINYAITNNLDMLFTKDYYITPTLQNDETYVGITINTPTTMRGHKFDFINNASFRTNFNEHDFDLIRMYGNNYEINNMKLYSDDNSHATLLHLSRLNQNNADNGSCQYNNFNNLSLDTANNGIVCDGTVYYNIFNNIQINKVINAIILTASNYMVVNEIIESNVNRNNFNNVTIKNAVNGVQILYGNTNKFNILNFEGVTNAITVNATTDNFYGGYSTDNNTFANITNELVTKPLINTASRTMIILTNVGFDKSDCPVLPDVYISSNSGLSLIGGMLFTGNKPLDSNLGGWQNFSLYDFGVLNIFDIIKNNDNSYTRCRTRINPFSLEQNASNIVSDDIFCKRIGNIVYINGKANITIPNSSSPVIIKLIDSWAYPNKRISSIRNVDIVCVIPIIIYDGTFREVYGKLKYDGTIEIMPPPDGFQYATVRFSFNNQWFGTAEYNT